MIKLPKPITLVSISQFVSDECHITGKASGNPIATLSFVAVDDAGVRVPDAPVAIVRLAGEAYNSWYAGWSGEQALYDGLLAVIKDKTEGMTIIGVDLGKEWADITASDAAEVVAAEVAARNL